MNTQQNTQSNAHPAIQPMAMLAANENQSTIGAADKPEDSIIMHDAKIITPQPYGVYGLCKIIEHLQNN